MTLRRRTPRLEAYSAYPAPSSIGLYKEGQGYVKFDQAKADEYFAKVTQKLAKLIHRHSSQVGRRGAVRDPDKSRSAGFSLVFVPGINGHGFGISVRF